MQRPSTAQKPGGYQPYSALSYYNKFRNALKLAWREKLVNDDYFSLSPGLKEKEAHVEFLTIEDVRQLIATPVSDDLCKRAVLFGILTGLRFADVKSLQWNQLHGTKGSYYIHFRQQKTQQIQHMPVGDQAVELMGDNAEPGSLIFKGLYYNRVRDFLLLWPAKASIHKHLTFSCLRHTYATLQLNGGTDIYTVSKMLGHRHIKTTQRYTRLLEEKKRETTARIRLEL